MHLLSSLLAGDDDDDDARSVGRQTSVSRETDLNRGQSGATDLNTQRSVGRQTSTNKGQSEETDLNRYVRNVDPKAEASFPS